MTDDIDDIDELLSAYLDGEATPAAVARIEADPVARARLAELRAAAALVATPVDSLPPDRADTAIAAALAARPNGATVIDLARRRRLLTVASIAAAVLLLGGIAIGVSRSRSSSPTAVATASSASTTLATREAAGAAGTAATGGDTHVPAAAPALATTSVGDLGAFADLDALLAAARQAFSTQTFSATTTTAPALACPPPSDATVTQTASARLGGQPVEVRAVIAPDGTSAIEVIDAGCGLLAYSPR
jgi:Putative zinc-finger